MMQFYIGDLLLIGITKRNVEKLEEGKPIYLELRGKEPLNKIGIMYGETKIEILKELSKNTSVPQWMWDVAKKDPS